MTDNLPASRPRGALAITDDQAAFTDAQLEAFGLSRATRGEQLLFLHTCQRTGLDPAAKQIYAITRSVWNPETRQREPRMTIQTGIDGFRLIADRTHAYAGNEVSAMGPLNAQGQPQWVEVTVRKIVGGVMVPFVARAWWAEYVQTNGKGGEPVETWKRMPINQLSKCAEALALRKAFPQDLSGVYTDDEMAQADTRPAPTPPPVPATVTRAPEPPAPPAVDTDTGEIVQPDVWDAEVVEDEPAAPPADQATQQQLRKMGAQCGDLGLDRDARLRVASAVVGREVGSATDLTKREASDVIETLTAVLAADDRVAALAALAGGAA